MRKLATMVALASAVALASCQTTVNGMDVEERSFSCGWGCVALGVAGSIGVGFLVASSGGGRSSSGGGINTGGGGSGGGPNGPTQPVDPCNGCWDY